ncbi:MAG TPA: hypothetical protein VF980_11085 [Thermoanaerobaculia bacterium]
MTIRRAAFVLLFTVSACGVRNPVRNTVTIAPDDDHRHVTVTARTEFLDEGKDAEERERLASLRSALAEGRDPWTARFASISAETERVSYERKRGELRVAERSATIRTEDLQRLLSDCGTVQITEGEGWSELAIYPGSSTRATRQEREQVESMMRTWSADAARYLRALDRLYGYLNRQPDRALPVFTVLFSENQTSAIEDEDAFIKPVKSAIDTIGEHIDQARAHGVTIDEKFDLVFNPLPAEVVVHTPHPIETADGFDRRDESTVVIARRGLIDAVLSLENRWASPDPLAMIGRASYNDKPDPKPEDIAVLPRSSTPTVTAQEIQDALAEKLRPAAAYRVRW